MNWLSAGEIVAIIEDGIETWHRENADRAPDAPILTERSRSIRRLNDYRPDPAEIVRELVTVNTEMWHEQDKVRSDRDEVLLRAIRNISPLNQHRNDLIEELDENLLGAVGTSPAPAPAAEGARDAAAGREIAEVIEAAIREWHTETAARPADHVIVTEQIRTRKAFGVHREDLKAVAAELAKTNSEIWHQEDVVRTDIDHAVVAAVRNMNPLNCHRNDLVEEIDEIILDQSGKGETETWKPSEA